jgi:hypothetical protein
MKNNVHIPTNIHYVSMDAALLYNASVSPLYAILALAGIKRWNGSSGKLLEWLDGNRRQKGTSD